MNANHGEYGRRACIYAILADGRSYALPNQEV
jgi:hypothetical protein